MLNSKPVYPYYSCKYLDHLVENEKLRSSEISLRVHEMRGWLCNSVDSGGFGWIGRFTTIDYYSFSNAIWFKHEQDLLAFKIRFGIHS